MIHFNNLKFTLCKGHPDGNSVAELILENGYQLDIIKRPVTRTYKVKPFEMSFETKKRYLKDVFPEYRDFPEFAGRELLMIFINEIDKHNLSDNPSELDEDLDEREEP